MRKGGLYLMCLVLGCAAAEPSAFVREVQAQGALSGASRSEASAEKATLPPAQRKFGPSEQAMLEALGRRFADAFNARDAEALAELLDFRSMAERLANDLFETESDRAAFTRGVVASAGRQIADRMIATAGPDGIARFMQVVVPSGEPGALVRIDMGDNGFNYFELYPSQGAERPSDREWKIADFYSYTNGALVSDTMIQTFAVTTGNARLMEFLSDPVGGIEFARTTRYLTAASKGDIEVALQAYELLPERVKKSRLVLLARVQIAGVAGEDIYRQALAELAASYGDDPSLGLMMIDHYYYEQRYAEGIRSIETIRSRLPDDGFLRGTEAQFHLLSGAVDLAIENARKATELDPELQYAHGILLNALIAGRMHDDVIALFDVYERRFELVFDPEVIEEDRETFGDLADSPAFARWKAGR